MKSLHVSSITREIFWKIIIFFNNVIFVKKNGKET
jgi:hypothetical protein